MACVSTGPLTELEFVKALNLRNHGSCAGPVVRLTLQPWRVFLFERVFDSPIASDVLWSGFEGDTAHGPEFGLCAAHWIDLACLAWARALERYRVDWVRAAEQLLQDLCISAQWDPKEIVNMFAWQRARLT